MVLKSPASFGDQSAGFDMGIRPFRDGVGSPCDVKRIVGVSEGPFGMGSPIKGLVN